MPTPAPDPTQPVETIPASEVAEVYPFLPPGQIILQGDVSTAPTFDNASYSSGPNDTNATVAIKINLSVGTCYDFGYVVQAEIDGEFKSYSASIAPIPGAGNYLIVPVPKKPTRIKVTILTKRSVTISSD
jgi:hypothetical protein